MKSVCVFRHHHKDGKQNNKIILLIRKLAYFKMPHTYLLSNNLQFFIPVNKLKKTIKKCIQFSQISSCVQLTKKNAF